MCQARASLLSHDRWAVAAAVSGYLSGRRLAGARNIRIVSPCFAFLFLIHRVTLLLKHEVRA